jgi:DNA repair exonuclease SbcCD ATPase subunit
VRHYGVVSLGVVALWAALASIAAAFFWVRWSSAKREASKAREELAGQERQNADLAARIEGLRQYQGIVDADAHARAILSEAQRQAENVVAEAKRNAADLRREADDLVARTKAAIHEERAKALAEADELRRRADEALTLANRDAEIIKAAARRSAEEIAGDALAARDRMREFEQTAQAMRNIIDGYGDRYVVPTSTAIDDLAEQLGYAKAGALLKTARETSRGMVKAGLAATCDYVELNRRETAIAFVLDAFNGKADSILADVREDNVGTLQQRLKDAFTVVNHLGRAFRNARILPEYLAARLEELHWAVAAQELKAREREEQRILRERIREEDKAQKEFERAQREAQKEEEMLRKAMDKVRREVDRASDEQKEKYEAQLRDLEAKLLTAEEKNQRAISMAQQTRSGFVYIISNVGSFGDDVFKIGLTRRLEPLDRVRELGDASVPFGFDVHALIRSDDAPALEKTLHRKFVERQVNKVNARKEFFRATIQEIRREVEQLGLTTQWTMAAECREWKETQALEKALRDKTVDASKWAEEQLRQDSALADEDALVESAG